MTTTRDAPLVFAAHDAEVSNAAVLKQILDAGL
jgi:hypothetical protein